MGIYAINITLVLGLAPIPAQISAGTLAIKSLHRTTFVDAMRKVEEGMSEARVVAIVGKPDDVRTRADAGDRLPAEVEQVWCYGTHGHLTFPTLGQILFDRQRKVRYIFGNKGSPPKPNLLKEDQVQRLLELIDGAPGLYGDRFDPLRVITIVNKLQPLGKDRALTTIEEYLRVASDLDNDAREGLFLVLRSLFDVPAEGFMPRMHLGRPWPEEPKDRTLMPRFPIVLERDIPLLVVSGYTLIGAAEPVEDHVRYFRERGTLRASGPGTK
jgi:hypothetical protein